MRLHFLVLAVLGVFDVVHASDVVPEFTQNDNQQPLPEDKFARDLAAYSGANQPFTAAEQNAALNVINRARVIAAKQYGVTDMIQLSINENLTSALREFFEKHNGDDWIYKDSTFDQPDRGERRYLNSRNLYKNETFLAICDQYPGLREQVIQNGMRALHDTFNSRKAGSYLRIVKLRYEVQAPYFIYDKCFDDEKYDNFLPCMKYRPPGLNFEAVPEKSMYTHLYYPWGVNANATQVAIVKLFRAGEFVKNKAQDRAWYLQFVKV